MPIEDPTLTIENAAEQIRQTVDDDYCTESGRVFATLIRLLGNFDLVEDAPHDVIAL